MKHKYPYKWTLKDASFTKDKGSVFSCFSCGGGSTMGYKLAGYDVIGCNEIDPKMMQCYIENHHPKYSFLEDIRTFKTRIDLPDELYHLSILDGSPPCSSFSMAGNREDDWGKEKQFREGQSEQVLDTLFFDFIDLAKRLQPKVVIAENVKGLMMGEAWKYMREIYKQFDEAGYYCQHFLLDASKMGVPQRRERVFFICLRKELAEPFMYQVDMFNRLPLIKMEFNETEIKYSELSDSNGTPLTEHQLNLWNKKIQTDNNIADINLRERGILSDFNAVFIKNANVMPTITANGKFIDFELPQHISENTIKLAGTFPLDYDFKGQKPVYYVGMSVPPVMTAQVASQVYEQWLSKL